MRKYHEMETRMGTLQFTAVHDYDEAIEIEVSLNDKYLGKIFSNGQNEWEEILNGVNPIENDWEDGRGNVLTYEGWAE